MKILCVGEALIDMICTDKGSSLGEGNHFLKKPGGAPTNVAAAIAAFGGKVALVAKVGDDAFGKQLTEVMHEFGVETSAVFKDKNNFTTLAFVSLMADGERDFIFSRGADGMLSKQEVEQVDLSAISIVHFGSATAFLPGPLQESYLYLFEKALQKKIFISFDPNYRPLLFPKGTEAFVPQCWNFLSKTDFFKLSEEEALLVTGENNIEAAVEQLKKRTAGIFCVTLGKEGTLLRVKDDTIQIPSIRVNAIDTTGAGDAFVGAILYQLQNHFSNEKTEPGSGAWVKMVSNANKAGARTCEYLGAMEAFKKLNNRVFD